MIQTRADILWNTPIGKNYFRMGLACASGFTDARPGQFVTVKTDDMQGPLLRRPFSIHRLITEKKQINGIEILYRVVGPCTRRLTALTKGQPLDVLGPLGNGFEIPDHWRRIYFVAGGIGIAPLVFLSDMLSENPKGLSDCSLFLGGRSAADLLCQDAFRQHNITLHLSTDDGSAGRKGLVTELLVSALENERPDIIYACGPMAMLKATQSIARSHAIPCQVSIETVMACGMGVCLGCAVDKPETSEKYRHVCIDGPVFDADTITL